MIGSLPESLPVNGTEMKIRTDFRHILTILTAFSDPDLTAQEKIFVCLYVLYEDFEGLPEDDLQAAYDQAVRFIDGGAEPPEGKKNPRLMDWEQDERLIFPAVNKIAGFETRSCQYLHWWTFLGYFMEIQEGTFSQVLNLRRKKAKGKKLEKWESEFWSSNKDICVIKHKLSAEEKEERDRLEKLLG